ncbi:MAG: DUF5679 domain-containing protein [Nanoarchaeota archaeon]
MVDGHCMKCKKASEMKNVRIEQTSRGGHMARGTCTACGTNMAKILSKEQADKLK